MKKSLFYKVFLQKDSMLRVFLGEINIILVFFLCLLLLTTTSFFAFKISGKTYDNYGEIPKMEVTRFILNRFNDKYIELYITGDSVKQYDNKEIYANFMADKFNQDTTIEHLEGKEVWHIGDEYDFIKGIYYTKTPSIKFFSQQGIYNTATEIFTGKGNFKVEDTGMATTGQNIIYEKNTDTIIAQDIATQIFQLK